MKTEQLPNTPLTLRDAEKDIIDLSRTQAAIDGVMAGAQKKVSAIFDSIAVDVATLEEKKALLEARLKEFAHSISFKNDDNEEVFPDGTKTLVLLGGTVEFNAGKPSIQFLPGYDEKTTLLLIEENIIASEDAESKIGTSPLRGLIREPEPELSKEAVMQKLSAGVLTPALLTSIGLKRQQDATTKVNPVSIDKLRKDAQKKSVKSAAKAKPAKA